MLLHECQWRQHDLDSPLSHITHISNFSSKENSRSGRCEGSFSLFCLSNSNSNYSEKSFRISIHPPPDLSNQSFHRFSKKDVGMEERRREGGKSSLSSRQLDKNDGAMLQLNYRVYALRWIRKVTMENYLLIFCSKPIHNSWNYIMKYLVYRIN